MGIEDLAADLAVKAEAAQRYAQAREGALNKQELAEAERLGERAARLSAALRAAQREAAQSQQAAA